MKVIIDNIPNKFIKIQWIGSHYQCNTTGHRSAHSFNHHPKDYPKDTEKKTNGHIYIFPSN